MSKFVPRNQIASSPSSSSSPPSRFLIYGCYGYTGRLIAHRAASHYRQQNDHNNNNNSDDDDNQHYDYDVNHSHSSPIFHNMLLGGRSRSKVEQVCREVGLQPASAARVFSLDDDADTIDLGLAGVDAVLHCAGPFEDTAPPMMAACLRTGTHYLDITGEIDVFERLAEQHAAAGAAQVKLCPGVGMDVVPTDCLARQLHLALPDATDLELALNFEGGSVASHGTTKTALRAMSQGQGVRVRRGGRIETDRMRTKPIYFPPVSNDDHQGKTISSGTVAWGDVASAYYSTARIPNISVYFPFSPSAAFFANYLAPYLLGFPIIGACIIRLILAFTSGPTEEQQERSGVQVVGYASNHKGQRATGTLHLPDGYRFTADSALKAMERLLDLVKEEKESEGGVQGGFFTPSTLFGEDFISECDNVKVSEIKVTNE